MSMEKWEGVFVDVHGKVGRCVCRCPWKGGKVCLLMSMEGCEGVFLDVHGKVGRCVC